ncbi:ATP-binding protein [Acidithiobacillus sp. M4-SHS-6]|uniref:ATP-binding protein n=1 Tax=Acidithiobacillus sp. M4-SHS-6 TaxID=3383024 RepID=UPI0039BDD77E
MNIRELYDISDNPSGKSTLRVDELLDYLRNNAVLYLTERLDIVCRESWKSGVTSDWVSWFEARPGYSLLQLDNRTTLAWFAPGDVFLEITSDGGSTAGYFGHRVRGWSSSVSVDVSDSGFQKIVTVQVMGSRAAIQSFRSDWNACFQPHPPAVEWLHDLDDVPLKMPLSDGPVPDGVLYPFLPKPPEILYDEFMDSEANILLLMGPPGTGKTSFIRGLLQYTRSSSMVSFDPRILERDRFFADFISGSNQVLVLEDADSFLRPRESGNDVMHRFLSMGNGLVSVKHKKIIFSTNLQGVHHIDTALTRPGRCFAVLHFRELHPDELALAAEHLGIHPLMDNKSHTLAELTSPNQRAVLAPHQSMGFGGYPIR